MQKESIITVKNVFTLVFCLLFFSLLSDCGQKKYPLHDAVRYNDIGKIKELLNNGYDINQTDNRGRTAIYIASLEGSPKVVEYLLFQGANYEKGASWKGDRVPLHSAAEQGHIEIVKLLLNKGANINIMDNSNETPLILAINNKRIDVAKFLIEKGANINVVNNHGHTPLLEACKICSEELLKILMSKGADIKVKTVEGETPISYIKKCNNKEMESIFKLQQKGKK